MPEYILNINTEIVWKFRMEVNKMMNDDNCDVDRKEAFWGTAGTFICILCMGFLPDQQNYRRGIS